MSETEKRREIRNKVKEGGLKNLSTEERKVFNAFSWKEKALRQEPNAPIADEIAWEEDTEDEEESD